MSELVVEFWCFVELVCYTAELYEVLWIWLRTLGGINVAFVVDRLIFIFSFACKLLSFGIFLVEILLVSSTKDVYKWSRFLKLGHRNLTVRSSKTHALSRLVSGFKLRFSQVEVRLRHEVFRVVTHDIGKRSTLVSPQLLINLVALKSFLEVD